MVCREQAKYCRPDFWEATVQSIVFHMSIGVLLSIASLQPFMDTDFTGLEPRSQASFTADCWGAFEMLHSRRGLHSLSQAPGLLVHLAKADQHELIASILDKVCPFVSKQSTTFPPEQSERIQGYNSLDPSKTFFR